MGEFLIDGGKIVSTHGVKGELKVNPLCDSAEFLQKIGKYYIDGRECDTESTRIHKNMLLVKFRGVDDVDAAIRLIGKTLRFDKRDVELPPDTYFHCDLIGLEVYDERLSRIIGKITDVLTPPANDVYVVRDGENEYLIPAAPGFIEAVDISGGLMRVRTIEGMV